MDGNLRWPEGRNSSEAGRAARAGNDPGVVEALIASGASLDLADAAGRTPIDLAKVRGEDSPVSGIRVRLP